MSGHVTSCLDNCLILEDKQFDMYVQLLYNPMGLPDSDDTNPGACVTLDWQQMVGDGCGKQVQRWMEQDYGHLLTVVSVLVCLKKKQQLFFCKEDFSRDSDCDWGVAMGLESLVEALC